MNIFFLLLFLLFFVLFFQESLVQQVGHWIIASIKWITLLDLLLYFMTIGDLSFVFLFSSQYPHANGS